MPRRRLLRSHQRTERFNPLTALARSVTKRPRARASYLPAPKAKRARTAKHKSRGSVQKIGSYAGKLIASKPVGVPKAGARIRQRQFGNAGSATNKAWLFGNNLGSEKYFCTLAAQAIITHLLRELGDYRSDKGSQVSGSIYRVSMTFSPEDSLYNSSPREVVMTLGADSSFNGMVENPLGALGNSMTIDGTTVGVVTERNFAAQLFLQAVQGYYPTGLAANRDAFDSNAYVYRDTQFGKAKLAINVRGEWKYQNITPGAGLDGHSTNINAVDANPLQGKIATYRNLSLKWNPGWLAQQTSGDREFLTDFAARPNTLSNWDYSQTSAVPFVTATKEQEAMPLRMATVFSNAKTSTFVHFPPGGFKTFKTSFSYKGSIFKFMRDTTQVRSSALERPKYPSLGDSFALCLVPTIKSIADEPLRVAFDVHRDGQAHIIKYRGGTLPTTNFID